MKSASRAKPAPPDKHDLYEHAVQSPAQTALFLHTVHAKKPRTLCDDFCGAGAIARAFLHTFPDAKATAIDKDAAPLRALRERADESIAPRLTIRKANVLATRARADVIAALNFPLGYFHDRTNLLKYLRAARARLNPAGVLVADTYGGPSAFQTGRYDVKLDNAVRYTWEQREANPLTGRVLNAMHFDVPSSGPMRDAFVYDWRLWSVPELRDAMTEAGFKSVDAYLSLGSAIDAHGRLLVQPADAPDELDEDYVAYLVARR